MDYSFSFLAALGKSQISKYSYFQTPPKYIVKLPKIRVTGMFLL